MNTMRFVDHGTGGGTECLQIKHGPIPTPGVGQVLVQVHYAGVNRPDILQRSGSYPPPADASPYLGLEISGEICALGADVQGWSLGQQVCALAPGGGYAEYCVVEASQCLPIPKGLSLLQAAALPETYLTVWTNVFERGRLQAGETFLVHGGSSGIGLTAIQLAKAHGAKVFTTVGSPEKAQVCRVHGADEVILYRTEEFQKVIQLKTQGLGVNLILDMVGGDYMQSNLASLALEGRLVQIAFLQGSKAPIDAMPIMLKRLTFTGSTLRARSLQQKADLVAAVQAKVWPLLEQGQCLPVIHAQFPLDQVAQAHALMESSQHIGKIMLAVAEA